MTEQGTPPEPRSAPKGLARRLARRRALARGVLLFERLWPALWPALGIAGLFVCAALLDLPRLLPPFVHLGLVVATAVAILALLVRGLRRLTMPDTTSADRRLEVASNLRHRPLAALADHPVATDEAGRALWQAHLARIAGELRRLRVGLPHPGLARQDRRALRGGLVVGLVACLGIAGVEAPARLVAAVEPPLPRAAGVPVTQVHAWITPPAYTGLAPVFLRTTQRSLSVPAGSHLTVSVTGGAGRPSLVLDGRPAPFRVLDKGSFQADRDLTSGGRLAVRRGGSELAGWDLTVVADQPPTAAWAEAPGPAKNDPLQTRLPWRAGDDYGVVSLRAELRLRQRPNAPPLVLDIPMPNNARAVHGVEQRDLTAEPWAGLAVTARLVARDAIGQPGVSAPADFVLPERPFHNPVARKLIAIRKGLSLHPEDRDAAVGGIDQLLMTPQAFRHDYAAYLNLGGIYYALEFDHAPGAIARVQRRLWELAVHMEEGAMDRTARALEQARRAVQEAMRRAAQDPSAANRKQLEERLQQLEQAIQKRMQALAEKLQREHQTMPPDAALRRLDSQQLERLAQQALDAARRGDMQTAAQRLAQLERMLDALRSAHAMTAQQMRNARQRQRGREQIGVLQDLLHRQGGLLDHAQQRLQEQQSGEMGQPGTEAADPRARQEADRRVQRALRRALGEMMQEFGDLTGKVPPALGKADEAMREATTALGQGNDSNAAGAEQRAIAALQKGGRQMGQALAKRFGSGAQGQGTEPGAEAGMMLQQGAGDQGFGMMPGEPGRGRDPLGRRYGEGANGADESDDVMLPTNAERKRAQQIEQELRRRGAERTRPQQELDYINRLLKRF